MASRIATTMRRTPKKAATSTQKYGAGDLSRWYGQERKLFLPGGLLSRNDVPDYLNGTLAGDYTDSVRTRTLGAITAKEQTYATYASERLAPLAQPVQLA